MLQKHDKILKVGLLMMCACFGMSVLSCTGPRQPARRTTGPIRAVWLTRWDYKTPADIARIMDECRSAGFNTVLWQVRGNGTTMYPSRYEPWAEEFDHRNPGFDPLKVAVEEAHRRGLSIHAWMNVIPGWRGKKPPAVKSQLYHARADWFWRDAQGRREPLGWYNNLNPCYPEVRRHIASIVHEIVTRYPVDGVHMDYVRYPNEWNEGYPKGAKVPDYPRDPRTLAMFRQATGYHPDQAPDVWSAWRAEQLTELVRMIRKSTQQAKRPCVLSAAVNADPAKGLKNYHQDTLRWINLGLLDEVYPMNYSSSLEEFERRLAMWQPYRSKVSVVMGINADKQSPRVVNDQVYVSIRGVTHVALFAYNSIFERWKDGRPAHDQQSTSRDELRKYTVPYLRKLASSDTAARSN